MSDTKASREEGIVIRNFRAWCHICGHLPADTLCEHMVESCEASRRSAERQKQIGLGHSPEPTGETE